VLRATPQAETIEQWRERTTSLAVLLVAAVDVPLTAAAIAYLPGFVERLFVAVSCAVVVGLAACPRLGARVRAVGMAILALTMAVVMLGSAGLSGSGRLVLFAAPLFLLVLAGRRYGTLTLVASTAVYGTFAALEAAGWAPPAIRIGATANWLFQGLTLTLLIVPLFLLIDRAGALQVRTLEAERALARKLAAELDEKERVAALLGAEMASRRALERRLLDVAESERNTVGQELHDGVCQQLAAAYLGTRLLERDLAEASAPAAAQAAELAELPRSKTPGSSPAA